MDKQSDKIVVDRPSRWRDVTSAVYFVLYLICCRLGMVKLLRGVVRVESKMRSVLFGLIHR